MTILNERIETRLPVEAAFAYIADFVNAREWDPGVASAERIGEGEVGVGSTYRLGVRLGGRVAPMDYRISVFDPPGRVVLIGSGSGVSAIDDIRFAPAGTGTRIDYRADIRLGGWLRLIQPLLRGAFTKLARNATEGMRRTLDERAALDGADGDGGARP